MTHFQVYHFGVTNFVVAYQNFCKRSSNSFFWPRYNKKRPCIRTRVLGAVQTNLPSWCRNIVTDRNVNYAVPSRPNLIKRLKPNWLNQTARRNALI